MGMRDGMGWPRLLGSILVCLGAGGLGSFLTSDGLKKWYPTLKKPSFTPPGAAFGPVWTTLYVMMGVAEYLASRRAATEPGAGERGRQARSLFALQLGLNVGWSLIFFRLRAPFAALVELVVLWISIVATTVSFARLSRVAAALMVPYLLWTTFAGVLNGTIWWLNRDRQHR